MLLKTLALQQVWPWGPREGWKRGDQGFVPENKSESPCRAFQTAHREKQTAIYQDLVDTGKQP